MLSDIKVSNKDNIAANVKTGSSLVHNEDFEMFKLKFLDREDESTTASQTPQQGSKRKSDQTRDLSTGSIENGGLVPPPPSSHNHHHLPHASNNINTNLININKKLNSMHHHQQHGLSLNDLNNHLMSSQAKQQQQHFTNTASLPSDAKASPSKSNGEHRLLNGLLSKPLTNSSEFANG